MVCIEANKGFLVECVGQTEGFSVRDLTRNGPSGGSTDYVTIKNTLILSDDPVAADAAASLLFGIKQEKIEYIHLAQNSGEQLIGESQEIIKEKMKEWSNAQ